MVSPSSLACASLAHFLPAILEAATEGVCGKSTNGVMSELFPDSAMSAPSPRLTWLKLHNLSLGELPDGTRFVASDQYITHADTHSDAELKMAAILEVEHWSIEEFKKTGAVVPGKAESEEW